MRLKGKKSSKKSHFHFPCYQSFTLPVAVISEKSGTFNGNERPFLASVSAI